MGLLKFGANGFAQVNSSSDPLETGTLIVSEVLSSSPYNIVNNKYISDTAKVGGLVVIDDPSTTHANIAVGGFTAGVDAVSNPTIAVDSITGFSTGDIFLVDGSNVYNDGLYEISNVSAGLITVRGIGIDPITYGFFKNQVTTIAGATGTTTKVRISVMKSKSGGGWECASSDNTSTFSFLTVGSIGSGSIVGTTNQINASTVDGKTTLSTPQNIHTGASPTFVSTTLSGLNTSTMVKTDGSKKLSNSVEGVGQDYINSTTADGRYATTAQGATADAALPKSGGQITGDITCIGAQTFDGRDVSVDGATLDSHLNGLASKHDATEIDYERADGSKKNIQAGSDTVESALTDLDDATGLLSSLTTTVKNSVVASLNEVDAHADTAQSTANNAIPKSSFTAVNKVLVGTGASTYVERDLGVVAATDILRRSDGDGRYVQPNTAATFTSIQLGATTTVSSILDEDTMASDSATALATQQSIKAYIASMLPPITYHINMPETPNDTVQYRGWVPRGCILTGVNVMMVVVNTNGNYTLTVTNTTQSLELLDPASFNMNTLIANTVTTVPITATLLTKTFSAKNRWTIQLVSDSAAFDGVGVYLELIFGVA